MGWAASSSTGEGPRNNNSAVPDKSSWIRFFLEEDEDAAADGVVIVDGDEIGSISFFSFRRLFSRRADLRFKLTTLALACERSTSRSRSTTRAKTACNHSKVVLLFLLAIVLSQDTRSEMNHKSSADGGNHHGGGDKKIDPCGLPRGVASAICRSTDPRGFPRLRTYRRL
jgi:hypothetical protein